MSQEVSISDFGSFRLKVVLPDEPTIGEHGRKLETGELGVPFHSRQAALVTQMTNLLEVRAD